MSKVSVRQWVEVTIGNYTIRLDEKIAERLFYLKEYSGHHCNIIRDLEDFLAQVKEKHPDMSEPVEKWKNELDNLFLAFTNMNMLDIEKEEEV